MKLKLRWFSRKGMREDPKPHESWKLDCDVVAHIWRRTRKWEVGNAVKLVQAPPHQDKMGFSSLSLSTSVTGTNRWISELPKWRWSNPTKVGFWTFPFECTLSSTTTSSLQNETRNLFHLNAAGCIALIFSTQQNLYVIWYCKPNVIPNQDFKYASW